MSIFFKEHVDSLYSKLEYWNLTDISNEKNIQTANTLLEEHIRTRTYI